MSPEAGAGQGRRGTVVCEASGRADWGGRTLSFACCPALLCPPLPGPRGRQINPAVPAIWEHLLR